MDAPRSDKAKPLDPDCGAVIILILFVVLFLLARWGLRVLVARENERCDAILLASPPNWTLYEEERKLFYLLPHGACDRPGGPPPKTGVECLDRRIVRERIWHDVWGLLGYKAPYEPMGMGWCSGGEKVPPRSDEEPGGWDDSWY